MKIIIPFLLFVCVIARGELVAQRIILDAERTKQTPDTLTFSVTETATATIEFSTGEVYLVGCDEETAAIVFWKKLKIYFAELVNGELSRQGIAPTHIQVGKGNKKVSINLKTGQVRWHKHKSLSPKSREFWDQVVLVGRKMNEIEEVTE